MTGLNNGVYEEYRFGNVDYPIRKNRVISIPDEKLYNIFHDLCETTLRYSEIANKYNVSVDTVKYVNNGSHSICKNINKSFPIRSK